VDTEHFVIRVDSISAPETIAAAETLRVRFRGRIGPDLCSRLERVEKGHGPGILEVRFHGERTRPSGTDCLDMLALLEHEEQVPPPLDDPFTIRVLQPDGSRLEKIVRVQ